MVKRKKNFTLVIGEERETRLFHLEVLGTKDIAIGPLEYCGVGMIIKIRTGKGY